MPIIALINQKGGTGKTTLATNLACAFAESGNVFLLDADLQGSAWDWAESRTQDPLDLKVVPAESTRLPQQARRLAQGCDLLIIDGPPGITRTSAESSTGCRPGVDPRQGKPL